MDDFRAKLQNENIPFGIERKFDDAAVRRAAAVLEELYSSAGGKVHVEYEAKLIPPRSVEVIFRVSMLE